jgi:urease accessory protein
MMMRLLRACAAILPVFAAGPALAHGGHLQDFGTGLAHPLLGLDHLVAMLAIGVWASQAGLARIWALPAAFLAGMAGDIALGVFAQAPMLMNHGIAGTLVVLGIVIALAMPCRAGLALPAAAVFGFIHGLAHGSEIAGSALPVAAGMLAASAALNALGYLAGRAATGRVALARAGGVGIAAAGLVLIIAG